MANSAAEAAEVKKAAPPYLAYKTLINFINGLQQGIPARIDKSIVPSMSGAGQGQLFAALRFFDLMDANGKPKDSLSRLVNSEGAERQKLLREIVTRSYSFVFSSDLDLQNSTTKQFEELFTAQGIQGETSRKALGLFLLLAKETGIKLSPHVKLPRTRRVGYRRRSGSSQNNDQNNVDTLPPPEPQLSWAQLLLSKFPSFDPNWPEDVKTRWFDSFEKLMQRGESSE